MRATKEFWKQFNDDRIHDVWKMPRKARDVATWGIFVAVIFGMVLTAVLVFHEVEKIKDPFNKMALEDYQDMIINYADCHTMKLILSNESLDHNFRERLSSVWLVNCST